MQELSSAVGEGAANAKHNAALVQAMLVLSRRPAQLDPLRKPYLGLIDGDFGTNSQKALRQFQFDQVFVGPGGQTSTQVAGASPGQVRPGDTTWRKLVAAVPAEFQDLRVLDGSRIVYVAATAQQAASAAADALAMQFQTAFGSRVAALIRSVHQQCGLALQVCDKGDLRSFQTQYDLLTGPGNVTNAGPGESNHNFGQAVDLGFEGLRWLHRDGKVEEKEDAWLHKLDPGQTVNADALVFWDALRAAGVVAGLFRGPMKDRPHLQAWSDVGIDMAARLADLLTRSGSMRWTGQSQQYKCDLGYGGKLYEVGRAAQIWSRQATLTLPQLTEARAQPSARTLVPVVQGAKAPAPPVDADLVAMRAALRAQLDLAAANWQSWRSA